MNRHDLVEIFLHLGKFGNEIRACSQAPRAFYLPRPLVLFNRRRQTALKTPCQSFTLVDNNGNNKYHRENNDTRNHKGFYIVIKTYSPSTATKKWSVTRPKYSDKLTRDASIYLKARTGGGSRITASWKGGDLHMAHDALVRNFATPTENGGSDCFSWISCSRFSFSSLVR